MQNRILYILVALVVVILVVRASVFTVSEGQLAIKSIGRRNRRRQVRYGDAFPCSLGRRGEALR